MSDSQSHYPAPKVPVDPVLSFQSFRDEGKVPLPSVLDAGNCIFPTSGRVAIALALAHMKVQPGDEVLLPAYHCLSMVEPVMALGAKPVFYKIRPDLSCDLSDIKTKVSARSRMLMVVHFFGFPQDLNDLSRFCVAQNLAMLEDCSHSFFGQYEGRPLGAFGDYAIASPPKFFPLFDGGCLVSSKKQLDNIDLHSAGKQFQLKATFRVIERAVTHGRLRPFNLLIGAAIRLKEFFWARLKPAASARSGGEIGPSSAEGGLGFDSDWMHFSMSRSSRGLMARLSRSRVIGRRRRNYRYLADALGDLSGGRVVLPVLPEHVVPYMFPFEVHDVERVFPALKRAGVPIYRWEDVPDATCDVSSRYSQRLLQFPCHQELKHTELMWMSEQIRSVMRGQ